MGARLYVGNLSFKTEGQGLRQFIEDGGRQVREVHIVTDRETGRSRGFAFVELAKDEDLAPSIQQFDGAELDGRRLAVSEARPRRPRGEGEPRRGPAESARPVRSSRPRREFSGPPDRNNDSAPWSGGGEAAPWGEDDRGAGRGRAKKKKKKVTYQKRRDAWDDEDYGSEDSDEE